MKTELVLAQNELNSFRALLVVGGLLLIAFPSFLYFDHAAGSCPNNPTPVVPVSGIIRGCAWRDALTFDVIVFSSVGLTLFLLGLVFNKVLKRDPQKFV